MVKIYSIVFAFALLFSGVATVKADADAFADENFSATVWLTSDYVFRGVSFSDSDPAVQASFDWGYENVYAGIWGSSLELVGYNTDGTAAGNSSIEFDFYAGYAGSAGAIDYDALFIYYWFPNDQGSLEADVFEIWLTLSHTFADMPMSPTISLFGAYSPDATLEDGTAKYGKISVAVSPSDDFSIDFGIGAADVEGDQATGQGKPFCDAAANLLCNGYGYTHMEAGISGSVKGFALDLRYHDTNEQRSHVAFFGGTAPLDSRIVFTASRSF